jgi:hypothetical protein
MPNGGCEGGKASVPAAERGRRTAAGERRLPPSPPTPEIRREEVFLWARKSPARCVSAGAGALPTHGACRSWSHHTRRSGYRQRRQNRKTLRCSVVPQKRKVERFRSGRDAPAPKHAAWCYSSRARPPFSSARPSSSRSGCCSRWPTNCSTTAAGIAARVASVSLSAPPSAPTEDGGETCCSRTHFVNSDGVVIGDVESGLPTWEPERRAPRSRQRSLSGEGGGACHRGTARSRSSDCLRHVAAGPLQVIAKSAAGER